MHRTKFALLILFFMSPQITSWAQQASYETFGQNRVQNKVFEWQIYDSTNFRVFYYDYGKYNAQFLLQQAELDLPAIVKTMGALLPKKLNIILYNSFDDYKQTNIGTVNSEINRNEGGTYESNGNNIVIYFDGTHNSLRTQVRRGIAKVLKDNILFGYSLKDIVRNAIKMNLPQWFTDGYVSYISEDWTATETNTVKSIIEKYPKHKLEEYADGNSELIGKSIFNFIKNKYNDNTVSNLLYLTKERKKIDEALAYVLRKPYKEVINDWKVYYCPSLSKDTSIFNNRKLLGKIKIPNNAILKGFAANPDGSAIAYSEEKDGFYKIKLFEVRSGKIITIIEGGFRSGLDLKDPNYPIIAWSLDGKKLAMVYEKDYKQQIKVYDSKNGKISNSLLNTNRFDRIHSMCFMEDDDKLIVSAIRKGQSNLYQLLIKNSRLYPITKDVWDDIYPQYVSGKGLEGVLFFSNRTQPYIDVPITNNELPNKPFQLFYYNMNGGNLINLSAQSNATLTQPMQYGNEHVSVLADINNTLQRYIIHVTEEKNKPPKVQFTINAPTSNNIVYHSYNRKSNGVTELIMRNQQIEIYSALNKELDTIDALLNIDTLTSLNKIITPKQIDATNPESYFLNEFVNDVDSIQSTSAIALNKTAKRKFRSTNYKTNFYLDYLQTSIDNGQLFNRYQKIDQGNGQFLNAPLGAMLKTSLNDILEDHKITAAIKIPDNIATLSYLFKYGNTKKRLDWELAFFHHADTFNVDNTNRDTTYKFYSIYNNESAHQQQNFLHANFSYPLSTTKSFKFSTGLRQDKLRYKARSEYSIKFPTENEYWWFNRLEYIVDESSSPLKNIYKGFRYKIYTDLILQLSQSRHACINHGFDGRYYVNIYKNIILANRFAGAVSYGSRPFLYRLGGIDNELRLLPNDNSLLPPQDTSITYGYQAVATNLRGYKQNSANGNNYFVINEELRFPVMNTFTRRKVKFAALRELQLVTFVDAGAAWPNITKSPQDIYIPLTPGLSVLSKGYKLGYGIGARTMLLGYYIRADIGWNIENRTPQYHLSFMHDF